MVYVVVWYGVVMVNGVLDEIDKNVHTNYKILNDEWVLMNDGGGVVCDTLSEYMSIRLGIRGVVGNFGWFHGDGITDYYVRNCYGLKYSSSKCEGGIVSGVYKLDPWNRQFMVFPYNGGGSGFSGGSGLYRYEGYYSGVVSNTVYGDEDKVISRNNVILITTSVNGMRVYCVDILAGSYKNR